MNWSLPQHLTKNLFFVSCQRSAAVRFTHSENLSADFLHGLRTSSFSPLPGFPKLFLLPVTSDNCSHPRFPASRLALGPFYKNFLMAFIFIFILVFRKFICYTGAIEKRIHPIRFRRPARPGSTSPIKGGNALCSWALLVS